MSQEDSLHKGLASCLAFRGKDNVGLLQLFCDNLHELYDRLFDINAENIPAPQNFYTSIANATEAAGDNHKVELER